MANELMDDHEQSEQVRKWLKNNANSIFFGIVLGVGGLFGYHWWKGNVGQRQAQAAAQYLELKKSAEANNLDQLKAQTDALIETNKGSGYTTLAKLRLAEVALEKKDAKLAQSSLEWVRDNGATAELKSIARIRLARLALANGQFDQALAQVDSLKEGPFAGLSGEVRGDALRGLNRPSEARAAYQQALDELEAGAGNRNFLEMKLLSLPTTAKAS
jgi:predicted negative regulator of RcsB-dependent stress response